MSRYISFSIALCFKKLHIPIISFPLLRIQSLTCSFIRINSTDAICAKSIQIPDSLNKIITLSTHLRPSSIQNFISSPLGFFSGTRTCGLNDTPKENVIALDVPRMKKQDVKIEVKQMSFDFSNFTIITIAELDNSNHLLTGFCI